MPDRRSQGATRQRLIEVITCDGSHHQFTPQVLDVMLENKRVMRFRRESGWVAVGVDPIRVGSRRSVSFMFNGPERRAIN